MDFQTYQIISLGYIPEVILIGHVHVSIFMCIAKLPVRQFSICTLVIDVYEFLVLHSVAYTGVTFSSILVNPSENGISLLFTFALLC